MPPSESEAASLSILYSTTQPYLDGSPTEAVCQKRGYVVLTAPDQTIGAYPTNCKSWRCIPCRRKLLALFIERAMIGYSTIGPLFFITNTFKKELHTTVNATDAGLVWSEYLKRMRKRHPNLQYLKVIELTKQKQPHFHCLVGGLGMMQDNCRRDNQKVTPKHLHGRCKLLPRRRGQGKDGTSHSLCLEHDVYETWKAASGDSFINLTRRVYGVVGLCNYLSKYMMKNATEFEEQKNLGFGKRWTQSYGWPKLPKMMLRGTLEKAWLKVDAARIIDTGVYSSMIAAAGQRIVEAETTPQTGWFERLGSELAKEMAAYKVNRAAKQIAEKLLNY